MWKLDISEKGNIYAVGGAGGQLAHFGQTVFIPMGPFFIAAVLSDGGVIGIDNDQAAEAIDDHHVAGGHLVGDIFQPQDGGNSHGIGDDGRMAGLAAGFDGNGAHASFVQRGHLRGRQIMRN